MISQSIIRLLLQFGSNTCYQRSLIVSEFQKSAKPIEKHAEFLKSIFRGGYGIKKGNTIYAFWYSQEGIRCNYGDNARYNKYSDLITWRQAAKLVQEMLSEGIYTVQSEIDKAREIEEKVYAANLSLLLRDFKDQYDLSEFTYESYVYDVAVDKLLTAFHERDSINRLISILELIKSDNQAYSTYLSRLNLDMHIEKLKEFQQPRTQFKSSVKVITAPETFITEDEINAVILSGSGFEDGKERIYKYFMENHEHHAEFLQKEYGIGGHSPALIAKGSSEMHNPKGMVLEKNKQKIQLTWSNVAARIEALIERGVYIDTEIIKMLSITPANTTGQMCLF